MKKTLVSALTAALVVGAASTTFAAANPFSDVPSDSWAYDAVSQLAADGVIEGYGDGTFRGQQNITRYEMAQMVAKAMAKSNVSAADKALIDKLAAEFSDELNNLGVRVSNLERNADMVKWNGYARYTYKSARDKDAHERNNDDQLLLRLEPSAEINNHWHVNSRIDAWTDMSKDSGKDNNDDLKLKRIWAQGDYNKFQVKLGKFAPIDNDSIFDTEFSGAEASYGSKIKLTLGAGRKDFHDYYEQFMSDDDIDAVKDAGYKAAPTKFNDVGVVSQDDAANYQYAGIGYANGKFDGGVDYHHLNADNFYYATHATKNDYVGQKDDTADIWLVKGAYNFDNSSKLNGFYANNTSADNFDKAWSVEYDYKGAQPENAGTWGAWVAYRNLGYNTAIFNTFDALNQGQKGWEVGANYAPFHNVLAQVRYGNGEDDLTNNDVENLFGRIEFFF